MKNKLFNLFSIIILIATVITGTLSVSAETVTYLQNAEFLDLDNKIIKNHAIRSSDELTKIKYNWTLPDGQDIKAGETISFQFPSVLMPASDEVIMITSTTGETVGTASIDLDNSQVNLVFSDFYENSPQSNRSGELEILTKFVSLESNLHTVVDFGIKEVKVVVSKRHGLPTPEQLATTGTMQPDHSAITWQTFLNTSGDKITHSTFASETGLNQNLDTDSIEAYYGHFENEQFIRDTEITQDKISITRTGFSIKTGDLKKDKTTVEVAFTTAVTDQESVLFSNSLTFKGLGITSKTVDSVVLTEAGTGEVSGDNLKAIQVYTSELGFEEHTLAGAEFILKDSQNNEVTTLKTDQKGLSQIEYLLPGVYQLTQTKAAPGYLIDPVPVVIAINDESEELALIPIFNEKEPVEETEATEPVEETEATEPVLSEKMLEIASPKKVERFNKESQVIRLQHREVVNSEEVSKKMGTIKLVKLDEKTKKGIKGVEFDIVNSSGDIVDHVKTDKQGVAKTQPLPYGDYDIVETKTPKAYK